MFNNYNPYYNYMQPQIPRVDQPFTQPQVQPSVQPMYKQNMGLQGKSVDSLEVVKAMDIPLDGSVSYFPLLDGSAIITKQLQQDGTSKMVIFKPIDDAGETNTPKYITEDYFNNAMKNINTSDINDIRNELKNIKNKEMKDFKDEIKSIKRQIRDLSDDIKDKKEE